MTLASPSLKEWVKRAKYFGSILELIIMASVTMWLKYETKESPPPLVSPKNKNK